jgi:hypothetical protein
VRVFDFGDFTAEYVSSNASYRTRPALAIQPIWPRRLNIQQERAIYL